jgi:hypothetical protein
MKMPLLPIWFGNGATAYELQIGKSRAVVIDFVKRKYWTKWLDQSLPHWKRRGPRLPTIGLRFWKNDKPTGPFWTKSLRDKLNERLYGKSH